MLKTNAWRCRYMENSLLPRYQLEQAKKTRHHDESNTITHVEVLGG